MRQRMEWKPHLRRLQPQHLSRFGVARSAAPAALQRMHSLSTATMHGRRPRRCRADVRPLSRCSASAWPGRALRRPTCLLLASSMLVGRWPALLHHEATSSHIAAAPLLPSTSGGAAGSAELCSRETLCGAALLAGKSAAAPGIAHRQRRRAIAAASTSTQSRESETRACDAHHVEVGEGDGWWWGEASQADGLAGAAAATQAQRHSSSPSCAAGRQRSRARALLAQSTHHVRMAARPA